MTRLTAAEVQAAQAWAAQVEGCTCRTVFDGRRYVVRKHTCDYCRDWDRKLTELGITGTPREVIATRQKRRRAA